MNLREIDANTVGISFDETTRRADVEALWTVFGTGAAALEFDYQPGVTEEAMRQLLLRRKEPTGEVAKDEVKEVLEQLRNRA